MSFCAKVWRLCLGLEIHFFTLADPVGVTLADLWGSKFGKRDQGTTARRDACAASGAARASSTKHACAHVGMLKALAAVLRAQGRSLRDPARRAGLHPLVIPIADAPGGEQLGQLRRLNQACV